MCLPPTKGALRISTTAEQPEAPLGALISHLRLILLLLVNCSADPSRALHAQFEADRRGSDAWSIDVHT